MPRQKLSPEEVESLMIPRLVEAIYPVLIPIEQQDCAIQAANHARMTDIARAVWRQFAAPSRT
jgi:hypothetical protein